MRDSVINLILKFFVIFPLVLLSQLPGCLIVYADDAGQISYIEHETLIELSKSTFASPLIRVVGPIENNTQLLLIYMLNLVLLSVLVLMAYVGWRRLRKPTAPINH